MEALTELFESELLYSAVAVVVAGLIRGFAGFGAAMAMVPPLSVLLGPEKAVLLVAAIETIGMLQLLPTAVRNTSREYFTPLVISACLTVPLGTYALVIIEPRLITTLMATVVLFFVFAMVLGWKNETGYTKPGVSVAGTVSGFLAGSTGMAGPPIILYMISPQTMAPQIVRGTLISFFGVTGFLTLIFLLYFSSVDVVVLAWYLLLLTPLFMLATYAGSHIFHRSQGRNYKNVALILLSIISITSLLKVI
ncbi:MAG: sulfite exporter TauE/SafE family protein [Candidatus Thiodiazotropha sp.]|jgi:uncharacterized protein